MFYLYHHWDLERLAELLSVLRARHAPDHVLQPDTVIVPNRGVGRWLQMQLAESDGLAANIAMPLLARFIWQLVPQTLPGNPDSSEFERHRMRWHLYALLPRVAQDNQAIAHYLAGEPRDIHRLQLADQLADVFDQYLIYRPGLLKAWENGRVEDKSPERWQAEVWQALTERLGKEHRARLLQRFIETAAQPDGLETDTLPQTIYCFGLGQIPPEYVKFLYVLGQHVDVHFLLPNPCDAYWGDIENRRAQIEVSLSEELPEEEQLIEQGHPLLGSLGRGTRDLLRVLYSDELTAIHEPELGEALAYQPPAGNSLLARVQSDIIRMQVAVRNGGPGDDASVQVHACHGPLREVQVLHDQLLDLLARKPDLQPRDIVVMLPDMASYAPAIQSVFGAAEGRRFIPYSVSDRSRGASHPIMQSFRQLLDLPLSRWAASDILALAAVPAIMRRFGLDQAMLATASDWVASAGVRWGYDADSRAALGAGAITQNTWRFGLDRLLLGVAQSDDETLVDGVAPWSDLEGGATAALGNLWHLVEQLHAWSERLQSETTAVDWQERLNAMVAVLFRPDPQDHHEQAALGELHEAIAALGEAADCLGDEPLSWQAVREALIGELAVAGERQPFLSGGVTFCGLMPLRAVPFRVVCLLGLNDGDFPRQERNRAFNILRAAPRLGDHNVRDDDRLLFLQAVMAARDVFYVSYTGQDVAGGETLPPSPLVGEWLEFLHRHYFAGLSRETCEARLVARQPMHPFSQRLFAAEPEHPRLFTFAREWQPASHAGRRDRIAAPGFVDGGRAEAPDTEVIELSQLRAFFDHPARAFLRGRLQLDLESREEAASDDEPLHLDGLSRWQVRDKLLEQAQRHGQASVPTEPDRLWRARGLLPPPPLDAAPFADQAEQVNALLPIWRDWTRDGQPPGWVDIDLTIDGQRLMGRVGGLWPDGPRLLRAGSLRMKYRLRAWIDYLAYRAAGHAGTLRLAGLDDKRNAVEYEATIDEQGARQHLAQLLQIFEQGQREPLVFLPSLAETYLEHLDKGKPADYALRKANEKVTAEPGRGRDYDADDPYFRILVEDHAPLGEDPDAPRFCELAEVVCGPAHRYIRIPEGEDA
ncbi:exodeoxyribonuclease V subunit gamma [Spectribacter hydrogenoxidans]|uniref:RecBCD enzyme subunit RecC n=1 Tax=Spectribacter hydrogenoxidans TaxID=3075608 RepID=A0ABU3BZZ8_9GAMM|nr:exodeoxyribonuclease V subunit gamma [Salinisphaera sp. W335]MDT0634893.1 exodeoxyribonuclease V subunit gamma [Salinisphaera sp. W335]